MVRPLAALAALLMAAPLLAGCIANTDTSLDTGTPGPVGPVEPYLLDCAAGHWNQTCLAWASPNESPGKAEIDIAVNPLDPLNAFVASKDLDREASDCVWSVGQVTFDGGRTWNTTYVGGTRGERQPGDMLYGWQCVTDPIVQFAPDGTLFYALQVYQLLPRGSALPTNPNSYGIQALAWSRDGGRTFTDFVLLDQSDQVVTFDDYMRMDISPTTGTVFVIWQQLTGVITGAGGIGRSIAEVAAYEPGAAAARAPLLVPGVNPASASGIQVGPDGTVYAWMGGFNGPAAASVAISTDDGRTFSAPREAFEFERMGDIPDVQFRSGTAVELAVDRSGGARDGCLYAAWAGEDLDAVGAADILLRRSCDKAATWTEPVRVNAMQEGAQFMPRVTVDREGTVHVAYLTQAHSGSHLLDAEHAYSMDGGGNWTWRRLTDVSFDGDLGLHQDGFPFIGDYIGVASAAGHTYVGVPVTQTGRAEIGVAHLVFQGLEPCTEAEVSVSAGPSGAGVQADVDVCVRTEVSVSVGP